MNVTKSLCVADLMTRKTTTVKKTDDLSSAISTMAAQSLTAVPVVDGEENICGVLSTSDLMTLTSELQCNVSILPVVTDCVRKVLTNALADDIEDREVSNLMTSSILTAASDMPVQQASRLMVENSIHHLPVIDAKKKIVGIISAMDVVRAVAFDGLV